MRVRGRGRHHRIGNYEWSRWQRTRLLPTRPLVGAGEGQQGQRNAGVGPAHEGFHGCPATLTGTQLEIVLPSPSPAQGVAPQQYATPAGVTPQVDVKTRHSASRR